MKNIFISLFSFLILFSCSPTDSEESSANGVDYEFKIIYDNKTYEIKGNTATDESFSGDLNNSCVATRPGFILFKISDPTLNNFVSGGSARFTIAQNSGGWFLNSPSGLYNYGARPGSVSSNCYLNFNITNLGTPSTGELGKGSYKFGETVKGSYSGTVYSLKDNTATVPHNLSISFKAIRLY